MGNGGLSDLGDGANAYLVERWNAYIYASFIEQRFLQGEAALNARFSETVAAPERGAGENPGGGPPGI